MVLMNTYEDTQGAPLTRQPWAVGLDAFTVNFLLWVLSHANRCILLARRWADIDDSNGSIGR
jgi:hypothetical protein